MKILLRCLMLLALCMTLGLGKVVAEETDAMVKDVFAKLLQVADIQFYLTRAHDVENGYYYTLTRTDEWMTYMVLVDDVYVAQYEMPFLDAPDDAQFFIVYPERYGYVILYDDTIYVNHVKGTNITFDEALDTPLTFELDALDEYGESQAYDYVADKIHVVEGLGTLYDSRMDSPTIQRVAELIFGKDLDEETIDWTIAPVTLNPHLPEASMRSPYTVYKMSVGREDIFFSLLPDKSIRVYTELPLDLEDERFSTDEEFSLDETRRVLTEYDVYNLD